MVPHGERITVMKVQSEIILSVDILTFLIGLPANILALYAFSTQISARPSPTAILLLNLTVSDLIFLSVLPLKMYEAACDMQWELPHYLCTITAYIFFSTIYTSSLLLMAVSVVRYIAVAFPIAYRKLYNPVYPVVMSAIIWLVSVAHCSLVVVIEHHPYLSNPNSTVCYEDFSPKQLAVLLPMRMEFFVVLCLIPLSICVFCYLACIRILYTRPGICQMQKRKTKAIGMAVGTLAVFLVCVLPYNLSHVTGYFQDTSPQWRYYTLLLSTLNTCLDPIIFYFSSPSFRLSICKSSSPPDSL